MNRKTVTDADVASLVSELRENSQSYHDGDIDHEKFSRINRGIWDSAKRMGCADRVASIVSKRGGAQ